MKSRKVYFVVGDPSFNVGSKNSAVVNFLKTIQESLTEYDSIFVNQPKVVASVNPATKIKSKNILKDFIKKLLPFLYNSVRLFFYFRQQNNIKQRAISLCESNDLLIEFLVFGSAIGFQCKRIKKNKLIVIYDSPLNEQFVEMYKSSSVYNHRITRNERLSLESADQIICYSVAVAQYLIQKGISKNKIQIIPCIVWKGESKKISTGSLKIGFIGSFLSWHKVHILLKAFETLAPRYPKLTIALVGFGEEWQKIRGEVEVSVYRDRIEIPGFVSEDELVRIKSEMDIGVMPGSNWYGSPLKLFEYAESGIPIIAPTTPTVSDYFKDGENALLINPSNELESLVQCLEKMIVDKENRKRLGENALKIMQNDLSKEKVMTKFVNLVNSI